MSLDSQLFVIVWGGYVRIGAATDPIERLAGVAATRPPRISGNPELVGSVPGGHDAAQWLHAALNPYRAGDGWYHLRGPLLELVDAAARSGIEDLAPRTRGRHAPTRMRSGDAIFAVTSARGAPGERRAHAMLLPELTPAGLRLTPSQPALCGAGVSRVLGTFGPETPHACPECRRSVPVRSAR